MSIASQHLFMANQRPLPTAGEPRSFNIFGFSDIATASSHFAGDPGYKKSHPNALCVTSRPGSTLPEKCMMAYDEQTSGAGPCSYNKSYMINADEVGNQNIPSCDSVSDPKAICVPKGTTSVLCDPDQMKVGLNVGGGSFQLEPVYIAVPTSEYNQDVLNDFGTCKSPNPKAASDPHGYMKTTNFVGAQRNPYNRFF